MFDSLSNEQESLRRRFTDLGRAITPILDAAPQGSMPPEAWSMLAESGILGFPVPQEAGGSGRGALDTAIAFEGLGLGCPDLGFLFAANAHVWGAVLPLALHGDDGQIARWVPPLLDGRVIGAHGVTEHGTGSDVLGMATTIDIGEAKDIHPKNKQDVGRRLANWALAEFYNQEDVPTSGPMYASHEIEGATVRVRFQYAAGLKAKAGDVVSGFVLAGSDKVFHSATAVVTKDGLVEVTSKAVTKPAALRYGWADNPVVNLVNQHNLPVTPFRTDDW